MPDDSIFSKLGDLVTDAVDIWSAGGWAMWGIAAIALVMFGLGVHVWLSLRATGFLSVPESVWRHWIEHPEERSGRIGDLIDRAAVASSLTDAQIAAFFGELRRVETAPFTRDLKVMKVCVSAAPLVGLLGTVTGMLATFAALASGSGGEKTMGMVAKGISEALITTETGLVIALPGLFFQYQLVRKFDQFRAFLAHLETVCTQAFHRRIGAEKQVIVRRAAAQRIARALYGRLRDEPGFDGRGAAPRPSSTDLAHVESEGRYGTVS